MINYKLVIKYIGTRYYGWQRQPKHISIQQVIEDNLESLFKERIRLIASGRTDAGVHALGQVANFKVKHHRKPRTVLDFLNANLPRDISILDVEEVPLSFSARFSAKGKSYLYKINTFPDPFLYGFSWYISKDIDILKLNQALELIRSYKNLVSLSKKGDYLREEIDIREINVRYDGTVIDIEITASHFLRHMVRKIVAHSVQVGIGGLSLEELRSIIEAKDSTKGIFIAPPKGLYLKEVYY
ncbi:MAG: tRNA pseudouridine(38-40) synthase TruA [Aquificae bacterium]|nr:tRNA pseudouridine(38-40) synthase TruA [Aquificota bacterium]